MAIFQKSTSSRFTISCLTKSASPTETPPVVITAWAFAAASRNPASSFAGLAGA